MFLFSFINIPTVNAKTIADLQRDLTAKQKVAEDNDQKLKYTKDQINQTQKNINKTYSDISDIQTEMLATTKEIEDLKVALAALQQKRNDLKQKNGEGVREREVARATSSQLSRLISMTFTNLFV